MTTRPQDFRELKQRDLLTMPNAPVVFPDTIALVYQFDARDLVRMTDVMILRAVDRITKAVTVPPVLRRGSWVLVVVKPRLDAGTTTAEVFTRGAKRLTPRLLSEVGTLIYAVPVDLGSRASGIKRPAKVLEVAAELTPTALASFGQATGGVLVRTGQAIGRAAGAALRPVAIPLIILAIAIAVAIFAARRRVA